MEREENKIPALCFHIGQFLIWFEDNKNNTPFSEVHRKFLDQIQTKSKLDDFQYANYALIIMLCYGLLVYPIEYWNKIFKDDLSMKRIEKIVIKAAEEKGIQIKSMKDLFNSSPASSTPGKDKDFLRKLRNAVAHAHIKVDFTNDSYIFWNERNNRKNFEVSVETKHLSIFLTGLARYFGGSPGL